jgi:hypothetical protein
VAEADRSSQHRYDDERSRRATIREPGEEVTERLIDLLVLMGAALVAMSPAQSTRSG